MNGWEPVADTLAVYNKLDHHSKSWMDPKVFDAPLTPKGQQQALGVRPKLSEMLDKK
jgi:hypothetical protein